MNAFHFLHIPNWVHLKLGTFQIDQISFFGHFIFAHTIYVLWPLTLYTVTFGFPNSKKKSFRRNYIRKYGIPNWTHSKLSTFNLLHILNWAHSTTNLINSWRCIGYFSECGAATKKLLHTPLQRLETRHETCVWECFSK